MNTDRLQHIVNEIAGTYPAYAETGLLDELRRKEFGRLDEANHAYLDYTGGGLYADSQITEHVRMLRSGIYGNPHSHSPSSLASTAMDEQARQSVLRYFNASEDEYVVIFTANASGALKLVGESYPFDSRGRYVLTFDNHNAVNGIREFARGKGASITYVPVTDPDLRIDAQQLKAELNTPGAGGNNLFVYPAQSNFSGVQHSLGWIQVAHDRGWDVVLDAAAFVPTNRLDLGQVHPDFVCLSFYKMFGYPTGVGCLIARRQALGKLRRPWFSGGTIEIASVQADLHHLARGGTAFEDGTINYLTLPAVDIGLAFLSSVGVERIHERVTSLAGWLLAQLTSMRHANGAPVVEVYGPRDIVDRGGTIALNFRDPDGVFHDMHRVEEESSRCTISLRTGCFCNPGAGEIAFRLTKSDMSECADREEKASIERCIIAVRGKTAGAVRVSLGIVSNCADVDRFVEFARTFVDRPALRLHDAS